MAQLDSTESSSNRLNMLIELFEEYIERFFGFTQFDPDDISELMDGPLWTMIRVAAQQCHAEFSREVIIPQNKTDSLVLKMNDTLTFYEKNSKTMVDLDIMHDALKSITHSWRGLINDHLGNKN